MSLVVTQRSNWLVVIQNDCSETLNEMDQQFVLVSSSINEVIRSVLNLFFFFFTIRFHKYKKAQNVIKAIQFFNRSHYSMFCSYVSKYIYYFSGTSVIKTILIFNWVLINQFLFIQYFYWFSGTNISIVETILVLFGALYSFCAFCACKISS